MSWSNLLLLILIAAGHTELMVTLVNRVHSLPIARPKLRHFRHVDDVLILCFPIILVWSIGLHGPALLRGGRWDDMPTGWKIYVALCGLGCVGLAWSTLRWLGRRLPDIQVTNHSRTVDIAERLGYKPFGKGTLRFLGSFPGNEVFRLQLNQKRYALSSVPAAWHGLSILHLTDTHFIGTIDRPFFEEVVKLAQETEPDLIVFTGDLLDEHEFLDWIPQTLGRLRAPLGCYYILGNHDWFVGPAEIREKLNACGWQDVAGRAITIEHRGHALEIGGTELPWMGAHPEFDPHSGAFRLLLSHSPDHFGWAREHEVDLMLAGHNHGGQVVLPVIGPVFAPSRHGVRYASGAFWSEPTLMYVSRGISGRHPLRLNCPPELTTIVLESPSKNGVVEEPR